MEKITGKYSLIVALLILSGALALVLRFYRVSPDRPSDFSKIPLDAGGWIGKEYPLSDFTLEVLQATNTTGRSYKDSKRNLTTLFIGYFEDQKYGSQIHSPRHCLPGGGWGLLEMHPVEIDINGTKMSVNRVLIGNKRMRQVVYYWFRTRSGVLTNEYVLKLDLMVNSLRFRPTDAALIRIVAEAPNGDESAADGILRDFLSTFHDSIENSLPFGT
ncbi:MAG: EpsI family protein [candidate division Zixibacteria bacterium]|nr:EpsI family protein [candidate division Zixibacteria bacterium]MBU1469068.1 EpsI family protein [candidate division Zixibacteria bacterium]MBU2624644.1 EpsI family protein [candidate division Zixibacteria bacterium]